MFSVNRVGRSAVLHTALKPQKARRFAAYVGESDAAASSNPEDEVLNNRLDLFRQRLETLEQTHMPADKAQRIRAQGRLVFNLVEQGRFPEAINTLKKIMKVFKAHEQAIQKEFIATMGGEASDYYLISALHQKQGQTQEAKDYSDRAFDLGSRYLGFRTPMDEGP